MRIQLKHLEFYISAMLTTIKNYFLLENQFSFVPRLLEGLNMWLRDTKWVPQVGIIDPSNHEIRHKHHPSTLNFKWYVWDQTKACSQNKLL